MINYGKLWFLLLRPRTLEICIPAGIALKLNKLEVTFESITKKIIVEASTSGLAIPLPSSARDFEARSIRKYLALAQGQDVNPKPIYLGISIKSFENVVAGTRVPKIFFLIQIVEFKYESDVIPVQFVAFKQTETTGLVFPNQNLGVDTHFVSLERVEPVFALFETLTSRNYQTEINNIKPPQSQGRMTGFGKLKKYDILNNHKVSKESSK